MKKVIKNFLYEFFLLQTIGEHSTVFPSLHVFFAICIIHHFIMNNVENYEEMKDETEK